MTVNDASLGESGSKLSKVAATSLLMGVTRGSSEAYVAMNDIYRNMKTPCCNGILDCSYSEQKGYMLSAEVG